MAILLARELTGLRLNELRDIYQAGTYRAIATGCHRFKKTLEQNRRLNKQHKTLFKQLNDPPK